MKPWAQRTLAAAAALTLEALSGLWLLFAGTLALVIAWWLVRLKRHPLRPCLLCHGTGRNWGSDESQQGDCARCLKTPGPAGREPRVGAVLMHPELRRKK